MGLLKEEEEEVTMFEFFRDVKKVISGLLEDPFRRDVSDMLKKHGLDGKTLVQELVDNGIVTKTEKIDEPFDEKLGKKKSMFRCSYKVPKKDFEGKIKKLYQKYINHER